MFTSFRSPHLVYVVAFSLLSDFYPKINYEGNSVSLLPGENLNPSFFLHKVYGRSVRLPIRNVNHRRKPVLRNMNPIFLCLSTVLVTIKTVFYICQFRNFRKFNPILYIDLQGMFFRVDLILMCRLTFFILTPFRISSLLCFSFVSVVIIKLRFI